MCALSIHGGSLSGSALCYLFGDGYPVPDSNQNGLRPVFTLKAGIKVTGGNGTLESPYTLGT